MESLVQIPPEPLDGLLRTQRREQAAEQDSEQQVNEKYGLERDAEGSNEAVCVDKSSSEHCKGDTEGQELANFNEEEDYVSSYLPITCYSILIALGGLVFGYDIGTIGGLVDLPALSARFGDSVQTGPATFSPIVKGALVSVSCLGGFVSGGVAAKLIPVIGMRCTIFVSMLLYALGNTVILLAPSWEVILVARVFNGVCIGLTTITCPMYISEITPIRERGLFTSLNQLFTTVGIVIGALSILFSATRYYPDDISQYQYPLLQGILLSAIGGVAIWLVPESPDWLVKRSKPISKVKKSLGKLRSLPFDDECIINATAKLFDYNFQMNNIHHLDSKNSTSILKGRPKYFQRTLTGVVLLAFQQFTGINYFFFYGITIFENVELKTPYLVPVIFGVVNLIFSGLSVYVISLFDRKVLLIFGSVSLTLLMAAFTAVGTFCEVNFHVTILLIVLSCLFIAVFSMTWGPIAAVVISELYPPRIKVKAMSVCGSSSWIFSFTIALVIPTLTSKIGFALGGVFALFTFLSIFFVHYLVPETKNVSSTRLDRSYETNPSRFGVVLQK
ncbi:hypothetical protein PICMEDRAFT_72489 [Pichia membranifaciens NRRL Y-2026]|uniref:Major facilitator superfamily (MFS) profile domain-containing protein n=1 Tax=Pichia membranifaciens NRRL Y-2026 TaxID=763406 RepID=A0A1E3NLH1_9ASCO|nr:hypothetical protein PICMEDRAFT_72489 [Pichia membranifaciens NRRL Y-2026]ODQ46418.1 hypothetical protein PICMEDRAFT_72489 [Pichia membranifaciens NRRL Y-2026]